MVIAALPLLVAASGRAFPGWSPSRVLGRARMVAGALRAMPVWRKMLTGSPSASARTLLAERPEVLGAAIWPYQNATWNARTRLRRIAEHCLAVDSLGDPFVFSTQERIVLADLGARHPDFRLVMDQPIWFMREGGLTLNLFVGSFRAFSIAFSFQRDPDGDLSVYVGAIQGRRTEDALDLYRTLTRSLHGIRPRDFLLECLRMLCRAVGVERLEAVSDAARQHNHAYFGGSKDIASDYDTIWTERGGIRTSPGTFEIPVQGVRRPLDEVKANKRSLYRQRYEFLDELEAEIARTLPTLRPVVFADT